MTRRSLSGLTMENRRDLAERDFRECDFADCNLRGADLSRAHLSGCSFARAEMHGTSLAGADLRNADLTRTYGLTHDQLRGTLLSGAKLPTELFTFDGLDRVRDLTSRAERTLYVLLLACASVGVICFATGDEQLFQSSTALTLPGVNLPVPLTAFYQLVPVLLLGFFFSLSFTLRNLWVELANLPARFHNNRWLHRQAASSTPSFTSVVAPYLRAVDPECARAATDRALMLGTVWLATPLTLLVITLSYLPRHSWPLTRFHIACLGVALVAGILFRRGMHARLEKTFGHLAVALPDLPPPDPRAEEEETNGSSAPWIEIKLLWPEGATQITGRGGVFAQEATPPPAEYGSRPASAGAEQRTDRSQNDRLRAVVAAAGLPGLAALLVVLFAWTAHNVMVRPGCQDLLHRSGEDAPTRLERLRPCSAHAADLANAWLDGLRLPGGNLRRAFMHSATLTGANLGEADLAYANLTSARLAGANLKDAHLDSAVLWEADLTDARLREAKMADADLRGAVLSFANMQGAVLRDADLRGADWSGALVCGINLEAATVNWTDFQRARGWHLAVVDSAGRSNLPPPSAARQDSLIRSLNATDAEGLRRWRDAWRAIRDIRPLALAVGDTIDAHALRTYIDTIDVSMGAQRQREQVAILKMIGLTHPGARMEYTKELRHALLGFREEIYKKALNHCHDVSSDPPGPAVSFVVRKAPGR